MQLFEWVSVTVDTRLHKYDELWFCRINMAAVPGRILKPNVHYYEPHTLARLVFLQNLQIFFAALFVADDPKVQ